jgi:acyl-CoA thioester hydrolase
MEHSFPVQLKLRLDWSEMDLFGHINNVSYFKFLQASRVNYWEQIGLTKMHGEMQLGPILASTNCTFLMPLHYPGEITIQASIEFIKNTSFGIHHRILNEKEEIAAEGKDVIVLYDFKTNSKVPFPPELKKTIEALEGRSF